MAWPLRQDRDALIHDDETRGGHTMGLDPVCMMVITLESAEAQSEYEGVTVHFCSEECKRIFDADPEPYIDEIEPIGDPAHQKL